MKSTAPRFNEEELEFVRLLVDIGAAKSPHETRVSPHVERLARDNPADAKSAMSAHLVAYIEHVRAAGRSPFTVVKYSRVLKDFLDRAVSPDTLDVIEFLETLSSRNTRSTYLVILRQFYKWLLKRGLVSKDPTGDLPIPKATRRRWPLVTEEEFERVCQFLDEKMIVLATILYRVGTRSAETAAIRVEHVTFDGDCGVIDLPCRKGGDSGFAVFGPRVTKILRPWAEGQASEWLFRANKSDRHISGQQIWKVLDRAGRKAGTPAPFVPHRLRHSYITAAVDSGWSQLALQTQVGHRDAKSTSWYYKPTRQGLLKAMKATMGGSS